VKKVLAVLAIAVIVIASFVVLSAYWALPKNPEKEPVYVGATYCGDTVSGGKLLIDK
jgi:energy-converting hydrogenase Eha subunit B